MLLSHAADRWRLEPQHRRIPPHHVAVADRDASRAPPRCPRPAAPRAGGRARCRRRRRGSRAPAGLAVRAGRRVERRVQHVDPAGHRLVAAARHHQQVARARGGHVGQAHLLGVVGAQHLVLVLEQLDRRAAGQRRGPQAARASRRGARLPLLARAARVAQHHDRELEPLGVVHGHHAHALGALLDHRRLGALAALGAVLEPVDEAAERGGAAGLEAARLLEHAQHVGQRLLAGRPDGDAGVRAGGVEEGGEGVGDRPAVAAQVQLAQERERRGHLGVRLRPARAPAAAAGAAGRPARGSRTAARRAARRTARAGWRTRELVVGPLDGAQRGAQRHHLLALVKRAAADQHVRHAARLERAHVRAGDVVAEADNWRNSRQTWRLSSGTRRRTAAPAPSSRWP